MMSDNSGDPAIFSFSDGQKIEGGWHVVLVIEDDEMLGGLAESLPSCRPANPWSQKQAQYQDH
jgi:hypothetical protein